MSASPAKPRLTVRSVAAGSVIAAGFAFDCGGFEMAKNISAASPNRVAAMRYIAWIQEQERRLEYPNVLSTEAAEIIKKA